MLVHIPQPQPQTFAVWRHFSKSFPPIANGLMSKSIPMNEYVRRLVQTNFRNLFPIPFRFLVSDPRVQLEDHLEVLSNHGFVHFHLIVLPICAEIKLFESHQLRVLEPKHEIYLNFFFFFGNCFKTIVLTVCRASNSSRINFKTRLAILAMTDSCGNAATNILP